MGVKLAAASGGSIELVPTNTASNFTVTVPATTAAMAIDGPAFSANSNSTQSISAATLTKVAFQTEIFDTANAFDSTTNYRFTPQVAGYYQLNGSTNLNTSTTILLLFYKNGSEFYRPVNYTAATASASVLIYCNGSTDYIELYVFSVILNSVLSSSGTYFQASMVRSA